MSQKTLKPGVVTGEGYKAMVEAAKSGGYALPAVNVVGTNSMNAVMEAAAAARSDIIIQLSNSGTAFFAGAGMPDSFKAKVVGAVAAAQHAHLLAEHYGICVAMHTDHANRELIPWVEAMLDEGEKFYAQHGKPLYSSHMLDLSADPIDFNLGECARILKRMAKLDMSLEIELGVTGGEEDGMGSEFEEHADNSRLYTQPQDVLQAYDLLNQLEYHSFTLDNQDYLAYICLILGSGLYALAPLVEELGAGQMVNFFQFIGVVDSRAGELPADLRDIHSGIYTRVQQGDPTPFKDFRYNEYLTTVGRMGCLGDDAPVPDLLAEEIVITQEVREVALAWRERGALLFGLSDKPDEASIPQPVQAAEGKQTIHRVETHAVGV
jgi:ketose-bisphosphate aldolase